MTRLRIYLADDHTVVRMGLRSLIDAQPDMEVVGEAGDGWTAWQEVQALRPDVVIMDVSMPDMNGARATEKIKQACPDTRVLALTVHEDRGYLRELLKAGASGYVLKRSAAESLIHALRMVAGGGLYVDPFVMDKVLGGLNWAPSATEVIHHTDLSDRETDVVCLIAQGYSNKEIAAQLDLSVKTVETYKSRSMEKLGLRSRADVVRYALHRGWLQDP